MGAHRTDRGAHRATDRASCRHRLDLVLHLGSSYFADSLVVSASGTVGLFPQRSGAPMGTQANLCWYGPVHDAATSRRGAATDVSAPSNLAANCELSFDGLAVQ